MHQVVKSKSAKVSMSCTYYFPHWTSLGLNSWLPKELNFFESKRISEDRVIKKKRKKKKKKETLNYFKG